jgi:hypothetical protein
MKDNRFGGNALVPGALSDMITMRLHSGCQESKRVAFEQISFSLNASAWPD